MANMSYKDSVALLQEGRIDFLQFVMNSDKNHDFIKWCRDHRVAPSNEAAEFFCDMTEAEMMDNQFVDNEEYDIWQ